MPSLLGRSSRRHAASMQACIQRAYMTCCIENFQSPGRRFERGLKEALWRMSDRLISIRLARAARRNAPGPG
jgi:hypothetical protein